MLDIIHYPLFLLSVFIFAVTPGPDIAYVLGQSLANGRKALRDPLIISPKRNHV